MNINIYYGGRGIIDDPTLYVIAKMQTVLEELRVNVVRYNLYESKNMIPSLPQTLKDADGVILATTVEWYGIGGYMQQFLDACWLYGDKEKISKIYMCPVVMATTYGEREAKQNLATAWELLGGRPCSGICGFIENTLTLEMNEQYTALIEKKAENLYRTVNQKTICLPTSNMAVRQRVAIPQTNDLTPQETEQLSKYVSDEKYVQRQKEDIQELTSFFKDMLSNEGADSKEEYLSELKRSFKPMAGFHAVCAIRVEEKPLPLVLNIRGKDFEAEYKEIDKADIEMQTKRSVMEEIVNGRMTFQRGFMAGTIKLKGEFAILKNLDQTFPFGD